MATAITAKGYHTVDHRSGRTTSIWTRGFHRVVEARQRRADAMVNSYLASLDDETLKDLGVDRAELGNPGLMTFWH